MEIAARVAHDFIHPAKTEARHLAEPEQAFTQQLHTLHSKMVKNFQSRVGRHLQRGQQEKQLPHDPAFHIAGLDLLQPLFGDTADFQQPFRFMLQHLQRTVAKPFHNGVRRFLTDTFQRPGSEVSPNALNGGGQDLLPVLHLKPQTVLAVVGPDPLQFHLHRIVTGQVIAHSDKTDQMISLLEGTAGLRWNHFVRCFQLKNTISVFLVIKN